MTYEELRTLDNPGSNKYKDAVEKRNKETDQLYDYYKKEMSHLAGSVRTIEDKYGCLDRLFRSAQGVMESWFKQYTGKQPEEASRITIDELKTNKELNKNPHVQKMLITYTQVCQQRELGKVDDPAGKYGLDADHTITEQQREGLKTFQQWLQKHCDTAGIQISGFGSKGPVRNYAEEFMKLPARVQLKALYLVETGKRKDPMEVADNRDSQKDSYVPDMNKLRNTMVASKFKFFKRFNGSQFYWNKLQDAVEIARQSEDQLKSYTDRLQELKNQKQDLSEKEKEDLRKEVFVSQSLTEEEISKQSARKEKSSMGAGEAAWDKVEKISDYESKVENIYKGIADNSYAINKKNANLSINEPVGKAFSVAGGVSAVVSTVSEMAELKSKWSLLKKKDVLGKTLGIGAGLSDTGSYSMDITRNVVGVGGKVLDVVGSGFCVASGAALLAKNGIDLYSEGKNIGKLNKIQKNLGEMQKELKEEETKLKKDKDEFANNKSQYDKQIQQEKEKELQDRENAYNEKAESLKKIEKIAKLSKSDSKRNMIKSGTGLVGSGFLAGSGTVGLLSTVGVIAAPIAGPVGAVVGATAGLTTGIIQAVEDDKIRVRQNRQYIDSEMYQSDRERKNAQEKALKNLKDSQSLFEKDSKEWKKMEKMIQEAEKNTEKFQDKIRDLYVAKNGYIHQTAGTEGIKDKLFGEVYDQVYEKKEPKDEKSLEGKIHTSFQDLLRSEGIQVRHTEERRKEKGASKEKVLDQIRER